MYTRIGNKRNNDGASSYKMIYNDERNIILFGVSLYIGYIWWFPVLWVSCLFAFRKKILRFDKNKI